MNQHELLTKLSDFKINLRHLLGEKVQRFLKGYPSSVEEMSFHEEGVDNYLDDLPLTINRDPSPGIKYYTTENSEFARGAEKEEPKGIDSFGERDTFDPDEASDYQTFRDRKQNSDLDKRFYTGGMDVDAHDLDK